MCIMNNSLDFVKQRIESGYVADWIPKTGWGEAQCVNPFNISQFNITWKESHNLVGKTEWNGAIVQDGHKANIYVAYRPEYKDFQYASFEHSYNDGTLLYVVEPLLSVMIKPFCLKTYNQQNAPCDIEENWFNYDYEYVVGDIVAMSINCDSPIKEKPWLCWHTVAAMPIAFYYKKH